MAIKIDMVKPIPANRPTRQTVLQVTPGASPTAQQARSHRRHRSAFLQRRKLHKSLGQARHRQGSDGRRSSGSRSTLRRLAGCTSASAIATASNRMTLPTASTCRNRWSVAKARWARNWARGEIAGRRSLIHWARAFRVAARPSHYLSLRYAASTQVPSYTRLAKLQSNSDHLEDLEDLGRPPGRLGHTLLRLWRSASPASRLCGCRGLLLRRASRHASSDRRRRYGVHPKTVRPGKPATAAMPLSA